jgi:sugar lactone lactonase YvrE
VANRRDFGRLEGGGNGDGLAVDTEGRLYVTSGAGIQVLDRSGKYLGIIPTPRTSISAAFAGPDRKMLYFVSPGATQRGANPAAAAHIYKIPVLSQGLKNRGK